MAAVDFKQDIPLFPLPNCVLFPGALLPLHIFEERYRTMMAAALAGQSVIAMALLKAGWEKEYFGRPEIHPVVCVGKIVGHERLPDGKYNLLLQGVSRAALENEKNGTFRAATLTALPDIVPPDSADRLRDCRQKLADLFANSPLAQLPPAASIREMIGSCLPVWNIADVVAFSLIPDCATKQRLLEMRDVLLRTEELLQILNGLAQRKQEPRCGPRPARTIFQTPPNMN